MGTPSLYNIVTVPGCERPPGSAYGDIVPFRFAFDNRINAELDTDYLSSIVEVQDIDSPSPISVVGGAYSIDAGQVMTDPGTVEEGQHVMLLARSAAAYETSVVVTLTIGGYSASWTVTTKAP